MTTLLNLKKIDVTARKTATIQGLQDQVNTATTIVALSTSKYNSFVDKANLFKTLLSQADNAYTTSESNWEMFLKVRSDLNALIRTTDESSMIADVAFEEIQQVILQWEAVTNQTIKAVDAINLASEKIVKYKATNPLVSNDLVTGITTAASNANTVLNQVIKAFTDAITAMSYSNQASNSTNVSELYTILADAKILNNHNIRIQDLTDRLKGKLESVQAEKFLQLFKEQSIKDLNIPGLPPSEIKDILKYQHNHKPLELSLYSDLEKNRKTAARALDASNAANKEMNKAKEELDLAEANLASLQAALAAAQAAVAG